MNVGDIRTVAIVGAGIMGEGIAQNFAQAGLTVRLVDQKQEILDNCISHITANLQQFAANGLLQEDIPFIVSRIQTFLLQDLSQAIKECNFIIEAIPEILALKKELFARLESYQTGAVIGSNTSSFTITMMSEGLKHPENMVGIHYFNPAHIIPLVEIHRGPATTNEVINTTRALLLKAGKKPVLIKKAFPGFAINRLQAAIAREVYFLIDNDIISPADMDTAIKNSIGMRYALFGPMEIEDLAGLDTALRIGQTIFKTLSNAEEPPRVLKDMVEKGNLGVKSGIGWYDYKDKSRAEIIDERNIKLLKIYGALKMING